MDERSVLYTPQYEQETRKEEDTAHFEVEVSYTFQDLLALNQLVGKTTRKWPMRILRIIPALMGCALLSSGGLLLWIESFTALTAGSLLLGVLALAEAIFYNHLNAWQSKRMMMKFNGLAYFTFGAEEVSERTSVGSSQHPYNVIYAAYHFKGRFFILLDKKHSYVLPEASFTRGLPAEFGPFLKEKSGKPVEHIC